jgi:hypothetical protein
LPATLAKRAIERNLGKSIQLGLRRSIVGYSFRFALMQKGQAIAPDTAPRVSVMTTAAAKN